VVGLGDFGAPGFPGLIADVAAFGQQLEDGADGLPVFLVGHSMGSFAAQAVIQQHSHLYAGVVLSGSTALDVLAQGMAAAATAPDAGPEGLEALNAGFERRTGYEWLSRDEAEVDRYVADPLSGFDLPDDAVPALLASHPSSPTPSSSRASGPTCRCWSRAPTTRWPAAGRSWSCSGIATARPGSAT